MSVGPYLSAMFTPHAPNVSSRDLQSPRLRLVCSASASAHSHAASSVSLVVALAPSENLPAHTTPAIIHLLKLVYSLLITQHFNRNNATYITRSHVSPTMTSRSNTPSNTGPDESFSKMSTGDVEAIGAHCQMPFCRQLDLLPFKCESCKG